MERFIGREAELGHLESLYRGDQPELFVLYGRRRVGKTELIRQFCRSRQAIYFQAAQESDADNLRHFTRAVAKATSAPLFDRARFDRWEDALEQLCDWADDRRLVVALDEFPWLCEANPSLPSLLQRFWDHRGSRSRLFLILCGSSVSFMEGSVLGQRSPLFGRRTGQQELLPLPYRQAAAFAPSYSLEDQVRLFGIVGGVPLYLQQLREDLALDANVRERILRPQSLLHAEPMYLLQSELRDPKTYNSILQALASGLTKHNEIAQRVDPRAGAISRYLATLEELRLVHRVVSAPDAAPDRRSRGRYFIRDPFLRFWYRFVLPHRSLLAMGDAELVWRGSIAPHLDEFLGAVFEDVCREYVQVHSAEKALPAPRVEVGRYWSRAAEIDVLSRNADGSHTCGECKWSRHPVGSDVLATLERNARELPAEWQEGLRYVLFSRGGFSPELREREAGGEVTLVGLADLLGVAEPA